MKKVKLLLALVLCASLLTGCVSANMGGIFGLDLNTTQSQTGDTVTLTRAEYERLTRFEKLGDMLDMVSTMYYQEVDETKLLDGAAQGMMYALEDPYSFYYTPQEYADMWADDQGEYAGVGIQISGSYVTLLCMVSRVFKDTPAEAAGIHKGDILVKVEDVEVNAYTLNEAVDIMRGDVGEIVHVTVLRGEEELTFEIPRAQIHVNWVESTMLEDNIGYICLYEFSGDCLVNFAGAVHDLVGRGATKLILDLRDNPGGWVDDALAIADMFLDESNIYYLEYRDGTREYYDAKDGKVDVDLVVMLNEYSASASEVLSGALQDHGAATIVGVQSFGKGVVQYVLPVGRDGSGMQFTAAQYFTPNGNAVHKVGITPDVEIALPEGSNGMFEFADTVNDPQLQKAIEVAKGL